MNANLPLVAHYVPHLTGRAAEVAEQVLRDMRMSLDEPITSDRGQPVIRQLTNHQLGAIDTAICRDSLRNPTR